MSRMWLLVVLLIGHIILLMLAATDFSIVSWLWGDVCWSWNYFQYTYKSGWGQSYVSDYTFGQLLCYIAGYGLGAAAFAIVWVRYRILLSGIATVLCLLGVLSFLIEASHYLWSHHLSWIASFPVLMVVLWVCIGAQLGRNRKRYMARK